MMPSQIGETYVSQCFLEWDGVYLFKIVIEKPDIVPSVCTQKLSPQLEAYSSTESQGKPNIL